jgi:peptidoglycan-associated lipoprotein
LVGKKYSIGVIPNVAFTCETRSWRLKTHMKLVAVRSVGIVAVLMLFAACHKQVAVKHAPAPPRAVTAQTRPLPQVSHPEPVRTVENQSPAAPSAATKATIQSLLDRIQDVYFDYDKHSLRPDAESTLEADAKTLREILRQYPTYKLTIEGFCDERGSDEYNLALGDSRAKNAQEFLENLGLPSAQLRTVSFGKEKPVCTEHAESCWQRNRRAHVTQDQKAG